MEIRIPCPQCGRELKLPDRKLLGRRGKCPKCSHSFVLEEPAEVQLELAEPEPAGVGKWIPENHATVAASRPAPARPQPAPIAPAPIAIAPLIPELGSDEGTAARLRKMKKKNAQRQMVGRAVGVAIALAIGGVAYVALSSVPQKPDAGAGQVAERPSDPAAAAVVPMSTAKDTPVDNPFFAKGNPTKGSKIELQYIPFGTQVVLNIRPAELWEKESLGEELRYCLPPLAKLLEAKFEEWFKLKPDQIEEAQICLIPGSQGSLPDVAAVVHLVTEAKKSQLLEFVGQRVDDYDYPVYVSGERAYLIADQKTLAMCPSTQAREMVDAVAGRNPAADGIDELLSMTDRERHLTLIFVPRTVRLHSPWWFPESLKPLILQTCDWLGDEVESASWSFHLGEQVFYSDLILRNVTGVTSSTLDREAQAKLKKLPHELLDTVRMMNPPEVGKRKVIGRLPKMSEALAMASNFKHGTRHVQVITALPERGAPNLALGTLLAWDESTRTDFTKERIKKPSADEGKVPELIADRIKMKMDIDFRRTPLQDAVSFIAGEMKTTIDIDGDALKAGGFTKNMPQNFSGDKMTAQEAIAKILKNYQDPQKPGQTMVISVNEEKKLILVTTKAFADQQKLPIYDVFQK